MEFPLPQRRGCSKFGHNHHVDRPMSGCCLHLPAVSKAGCAGFEISFGPCWISIDLLFRGLQPGFIHLVGYELHGLGDSVPFFLLLLDLSKVTSLAKYSLLNYSQDVSVKETVARGMAILGPSMTLDTLVETLVIAIGCISGIPMLEGICCFGCISLIVHYVVFMTFFPGLLCLILELDSSRHSTVVPKMKKHEMESQPNPAAQRVKLIMCTGLALVHVYSKLTAEKPGIVDRENSLDYEKVRSIVPSTPLWEFYLKELFQFTPQQLVTYAFILILCLKYIFYDTIKKTEKLSAPSCSGSEISPVSPKESHLAVNGVGLGTAFTKQSPIIGGADRKRKFTVGSGDNDEELLEILPAVMEDRGVQTDQEADPIVRRPTTLLKLPTPNLTVMKQKDGVRTLTDDEILSLVKSKQLQSYKLEEELGDLVRAVNVRRSLISSDLPEIDSLQSLPYTDYDYSYVSCTKNCGQLLSIHKKTMHY
jgi:hydroxymethylglutaryl-CoA reductase (NADPH)